MPRISIEIPADILAELDRVADEFFSSRSAALKTHWKRYRQLLSDSTSNRTSENTINTVVAHTPLGPHTPDPAHAPVHDDKQTNNQSDKDTPSDPDPEQSAAELIITLDWFGAKLSKSDTPHDCARRLVKAHPEVDVPAQLYRAADWMVNNPTKRKKRLGAFLSYWMGPGQKYNQTQLPVPLSKLQDFKKGVDENGHW